MKALLLYKNNLQYFYNNYFLLFEDIMKENIENISLENLKTPVFITDVEKIKNNVTLLNFIQELTNAKVLLALKAFSQYSTFDVISKKKKGFLHGCCASSVYEARLAKEEFGGEVHAFAAAYSKEEMEELLPLCDHIIFNSFYQLNKFYPQIAQYKKDNSKNIEIGLRINPEYSEGKHEMYDPCSLSSRLGIRIEDFEAGMHDLDREILNNISGLHFHTLCEQNSDALERTLDVVEAKFGKYLENMKWLNFGGGHHITRNDYNIDLLCSCIKKMQEKYGLEVYLEPGEAVVLNAGYFVSTVLDIINADIPTAILDCSAACHMPDVLEMPYTPQVFNASIHGDMEPITESTYRLAGKSCLAGDTIGIYNFADKLQRGDKIIFKDMALYSMVKTNTFNGIALPSIARLIDAKILIDKNFNYEDFKVRI